MVRKNKLKYEYISTKNLDVDRRFSVVSILKDVTNDAWCDFGKSYDAWLDMSNYLVIVKDGNRCVAFDLKGRSGIRDLTFISSMVRKEYQSRGITARASRINIKHHYYYLLSLGLASAISILFRPVYFVFRTPNPRIYYSICKYNPFPSIVSPRACSTKELDMARRLVSALSPDCKFNEDTFVIEGALKNKGLYYSQHDYPKSKSPEINSYFERAIDYKNNCGNLQVIVGRIGFWDLIR